MMSKTVVALALLEEVAAFQAPVVRSTPLSSVTMFSEGDIGVLPPLGVYDPLGLIETRNMFRYGARRRRLPQSRPAQPGRSPRACAPATPARCPLQLP